MEKVILLFFIILYSIQSQAQTERYTTDIPASATTPFLDISQRINVDFEIKGNPLVDKETLKKINLFPIDQHRQIDTRVEIIDIPTGLTLIVYSVNEATRNKAIILFGGVD